MKNTVQAIKLSEPLKSVETPNKKISSSNANNTEGGNAFQNMLNQQVQERQQLERNAENKKSQEKETQPAQANNKAAPSSQPEQAKSGDTVRQHTPFAKPDMTAKTDAFQTEKPAQYLTKLQAKGTPAKQVVAEQAKGHIALDSTVVDALKVDLKTDKLVDANPQAHLTKKTRQPQAVEVENTANTPTDTNVKTVIVDAPVRHEQMAKSAMTADAETPKPVKQLATETADSAAPKPKPAIVTEDHAVKDQVATKNTKVKPTVSAKALDQKATVANNHAVNQKVSTTVPTHAIDPLDGKPSVDETASTKPSLDETASTKLTGKPVSALKTVQQDTLVDSAVKTVPKTPPNKVVDKNPTAVAKADPVEATEKQAPIIVAGKSKLSDTIVEQRQPITESKKTVEVDDVKHDRNKINSQVTKKPVQTDTNVGQTATQASVDAKVVTPKPINEPMTTEAVLLSPVDAMVKQASSAVARKKSQEKVELAKDLQAAGTEKEFAEADDALIGQKDGRLSPDQPRAGVRTTDFVQTLNQNVLNSQMKMRGEQPEAFKSFASIQGMGEVSGANAQALSGLQATTPPSTLQAAASLMSSPLAGSNLINTPFSNRAGWNQAISQKVMYMVGNGDQTAKLTLNPPDLGPLQVVISVNNEKADTTFISANEDVRRALEDGMENLREKMDEAGVSLGQTNVNTGEQFAQQQQQSTQSQTRAQTNQPAIETEALMNSTPVARNSNGLVDTFA